VLAVRAAVAALVEVAEAITKIAAATVKIALPMAIKARVEGDSLPPQWKVQKATLT
jgi:hypothetical protein